jgi:uncharacterized membrane protein YidH (DUF202 family)
MTTAPRDPGLQPERTALAWQRTALALAGATIVVGRLTFGTVGVVAVVVVALGVGHAAVIFATSQRHYRNRTGTSPARQWPTGVHAILLSVQVAALSVLELLDVLRP